MKHEENASYLSQNRIFALGWRLFIVILCGFGLIPMFISANGTQILCYFTMQSNLLVAALFVDLSVGTALQLRSGKRGAIFHIAPSLQTAVIYFVQITFLVYATMLSGSLFSMGSSVGIANLMLHYIAPLAALADFVLFAPHGTLSQKSAAVWLSYPAAYVVFAFIRAEIGKPFGDGARYPYFFMDFDKLGFNVIWVCALFFAFFFLLGTAFVAVDKKLAKRHNKSENSEEIA